MLVPKTQGSRLKKHKILISERSQRDVWGHTVTCHLMGDSWISSALRLYYLPYHSTQYPVAVLDCMSTLIPSEPM